MTWKWVEQYTTSPGKALPPGMKHVVMPWQGPAWTISYARRGLWVHWLLTVSEPRGRHEVRRGRAWRKASAQTGARRERDRLVLHWKTSTMLWPPTDEVDVLEVFQVAPRTLHHRSKP